MTWKRVPLGDLVTRVDRSEPLIIGKRYRQLGVRLWGNGAYERETIDGGQTKYKALSKVDADDIVVNKIWARNGSVALIPESLAGCYVSGEFPTFSPDKSRLFPGWFRLITKTKDFWNQCDEKSRGTTGKNRIRPEKFLEVKIPLPSVEEQQHIVSYVDSVLKVVEQVKSANQDTERELDVVLRAAYHEVITDAEWKPFAEVAKLHRRKVVTEPDRSYKELGVRSFGKGTFHKPALTGTELGSKRIFHIEPNDLVFNIVFAWEGAVAVVKPEDAGRVGSHRFLTYVPDTQQATAKFLAFHFLTYKGLEDLGKASPGAAGRNKTLGVKALEAIKVPVPRLESQRWFERLVERRDEVMRIKRDAALELAAVEPALLQRAFSFVT